MRRSYGSPYSGGEFSDYAVMNLGFIATNVYGRSAQIRLRPSFAADPAIDTAYRWLLGQQFDRVVLSWHGDEWTNEMLRSCKEALERLDVLLDDARRTPPAHFLSRPVKEASPKDAANLRGLMDRWAQLYHSHDEVALKEMLQSVLGSRYVVVRADNTSPHLRFAEFGDGLYANCDTWRSCAVGAPIQEQPDRMYGQWVSAAYKDAMRDRQPRVEQIDAFVRWPQEGRIRMRYQRLILPLRINERESYLLGASLIDDRIDLRIGERPQVSEGAR